ncbi:MAG: phenylacetate-CoA oxygenase subunit PaaI [Sphingobacteriales bacterium]|nr:MAG: phenylacetate-CoA oxygenase subunit PaaI [Sphingobacteriales bacterium]
MDNSMEQNKIEYLLFLADSNLILSQKNAEWCGHGPVLEQDIAITNITLDLLGQSRNFYQYAAELINQSTGQPATEDTLAYLRTEREFKNLLLCELPKGDWAQSVLKLFFFSVYAQLLYTGLANGKDERIAAIAEKSLKETNYHVRWSSEWIIRMGDGTEESNQRLKNALQYLWPFTGELFVTADFEKEIGIDLLEMKNNWQQKIQAIFEEATINMPDINMVMQSGGKQGVHTEHMGFILAEMQYLQRVYPGAEW